MTVIAINASPRKNGNTAKMLQKVLDGAIENGAQTKLIHLTELNFSGCSSCFACKAKTKKVEGQCFYQDDLTELLKEISLADALILGSPFYFQSLTGAMRMFLERLLFPYRKYETGYPSLFKGNLKIGFIYTMNVTKEQLDAQFPFMQAEIEKNEYYMKHVFNSCHTLCAFDTYQFDDYAKYDAPIFDEKHKMFVRDENFPKYLKKAYEMGKSFT